MGEQNAAGGNGRFTGFNVLRWSVALGLVAYVIHLLVMGLDKIPALAVRPGWLALSLLGLAGAIALGCECWRRWVVAAGVPLGYGAAFGVLYQSNLAKYVPGGPWHFVGRVVLVGRHGVSARVASLAIVMDAVGHLAGALLFAVLTACLVGIAPPLWALLAAAVLLVGLHPAVLNGAWALAARWRNRPVTVVPYSYGRVLGMLLLYLLDWILIGAGFAAFAFSLAPASGDGRVALMAAGALATAWAAGALAVFAPAGLGVREAALTALLAGPFGPAPAAAIALASRAWFVVGDLAAFAIAVSLPDANKPGATKGLADGGQSGDA